jgi:hypothetical protein
VQDRVLGDNATFQRFGAATGLCIKATFTNSVLN